MTAASGLSAAAAAATPAPSAAPRMGLAVALNAAFRAGLSLDG
jgi:hypothetical protein